MGQNLPLPMPDSGKGVGQRQGHAKKRRRDRPPQVAHGAPKARELPLGPRFFAKCVAREALYRNASSRHPRGKFGRRGMRRPETIPVLARRSCDDVRRYSIISTSTTVQSSSC